MFTTVMRSPSLLTFGDLWPLTEEILSPQNLASLFLKKDFSYRQGRAGHELWAERLEVKSHSGVQAQCRLVSISSPKVDILNTMIFPSTPENLPVFAAELLSFGPAKKVVFIDIQNPGLKEEATEAVREKTKVIKNRFSWIPQNHEVPQWAISHSPGNFFFTRLKSQNYNLSLHQIYMLYLLAWRECLEEAIPEEKEDKKARAELRFYKDHHVENSPGPRFLSGIFGGQWTDSFLRDFLYQ